jgi:outer membrane biogenesis lipoprotein LolB
MNHCSNYSYKLLTGLLFLIIQGCASTPPAPLTLQQPLNWQTTIDHILSIENWEFTGKIGVRVPERIDSAVINRWQQQGDKFTIDLSSAIFWSGRNSHRRLPSQNHHHRVRRRADNFISARILNPPACGLATPHHSAKILD